MWVARDLAEWREYYLLVGTAGATLVALLFVAASLGAGYLTAERAAATRTFMSPVVAHFAAVFFISAVALVPSLSAMALAIVIGIAAIIGITFSTVTTVQVFTSGMTHYREDYLAYGLLPVVAYAALLVAAGLIAVDWEPSLDVLAGALLLLVLVNIRNVWDLTLTMVRQHRGPD